MLSRPLVILGCGFIGNRLARAALAAGRPVRVTTRRPDKLAELAALGAEVIQLEAKKQRAFAPPLIGTEAATVVYSIPPHNDLPAGVALARASQEARERGVRRFIYLGSSGLYGNRPNLDWVDEQSGIALDDAVMAPFIREEGELQQALAGGLHTVVLRLAAVYGGGRGVRKRLLAGDYKLTDGGEHYISRIHIDDLVSIIQAAEERAPAGATYLVADDRPTLQKEYAAWLCQRLGLPMVPSPMIEPHKQRPPQRGRRLRNDRLKDELGVVLKYPSFVEGEAQIEAEEAGLADALAGGVEEGKAGEDKAATAAPSPTTSTSTSTSPSTSTSTSPSTSTSTSTSPSTSPSTTPSTSTAPTTAKTVGVTVSVRGEVLTLEVAQEFAEADIARVVAAVRELIGKR